MYKTVDGRLGFSKETFGAVKIKAEQAQKQSYSSLIFDEIRIKCKGENKPSTDRDFGFF